MKRVTDITPAEAKDIQESVDLIVEALDAALVKARNTSTLKDEVLNSMTGIAIFHFIIAQGDIITPQIPLSVARMLVEVLIQNGYGEAIGITTGDEGPVTLQ